LEPTIGANLLSTARQCFSTIVSTLKEAIEKNCLKVFETAMGCYKRLQFCQCRDELLHPAHNLSTLIPSVAIQISLVPHFEPLGAKASHEHLISSKKEEEFLKNPSLNMETAFDDA